jgi:hypothetical protein
MAPVPHLNHAIHATPVSWAKTPDQRSKKEAACVRKYGEHDYVSDWVVDPYHRTADGHIRSVEVYVEICARCGHLDKPLSEPPAEPKPCLWH